MDRTTVKSTCCYCGVGCGLLVHRDREGQVRVEGDPDHPVNRGQLCSKGRTLHHTVNDTGDRLTVPLVRDEKGGPLREAGWDEALDRVAAAFRRALATRGPRSLAFYVSGQCLTEEYYVANKLMKGFVGSNNIDTNSRLCMSSAVAAYKIALGEDTVPGCYEDVELADCWLVAGANPAWCHPILYRRLEARRQRPDRGHLIVIDPRRTQTAADADLHLAVRPGTDAVLFRALARLLRDQGAVDRAFVTRHAEDWEAFEAALDRHDPADDAQVCGVALEDLVTAAGWIAASKGFVSLWAMGLNQSQAGVEKNLGLLHLHLMTGRIGTPGNTPFSLTGQPNAMGGREVGGLANLLPAHRDLANPADRAEVARFWGGTELDAQPGLTATQIVDAALEGRLEALWIASTNPLVSLPDLNRVEAALRAVPLVVVQEMSRRADTLSYADVVLPAATWAEKSGTMTNSERRIGRLNALVPPPGSALPDVQIWQKFAAKMGWADSFAWATPQAIWDEHAALTRGTRIDVAGLTGSRLAGGTFQWPVPTADHPGTPRLFGDRVFATPSGRARFTPPTALVLPQPPPADRPLVLTSGRLRDQWHTRTRTGKVRGLDAHEPEAFLEMHPADAADRGLADGRLVAIDSCRGTAAVRLRITEDIRPGVVFLPMHWGRLAGRPEARVNNLTTARLDPRSKQPDLKFEFVEVRPRPAGQGRVVVVGAGNAAAAFCRTLADEGWEGPVTVFSEEADSFYQRLQLPAYLEGAKAWDELGLDPGIRPVAVVHDRVTHLDREGRTVTDRSGRVTPYDVLVLATGSRPRRPSWPGADLPGVLTFRRRRDADDLAGWLGQAGSAVVVGGGVLAVEAAAALRALGHRVTLVHRSQAVLERVASPEAAALVTGRLADLGWPLRLGTEVAAVEGADRVEAVVLTTGERLEAQAVVVALGTEPRIELARAAGLETARGIVVNDRLETSDPAVLALGEAAEGRGVVAGLAAAAEAQAEAAARALAGDPFGVYRPAPPVSVLKAAGVEFAGGGDLAPPGADLIELADPAWGVLQQVWVHRDRVVGFCLVGDRAPLAGLKELLVTGRELGDRRSTLLRGGGPAPGEGRTVCSCLGVRESTLRQAGSGTVPALMAATGAGTGCGSCRPELARYCRATPAAV